MHQSMQVDANRLLKCPNLSINCLDASGIVLGTFLLGNKLGVTLHLCSGGGRGWWRWAGTSSKAGRGQCRVWRQGGECPRRSREGLSAMQVVCVQFP